MSSFIIEKYMYNVFFSCAYNANIFFILIKKVLVYLTFNNIITQKALSLEDYSEVVAN